MFPQVALLVAILGSTLSPVPRIARRWGPLGHRIVAEVALDRLSRPVADETRRLLGGQNITDIASWADEHRSEMPNASPWHYVDIEITDSSYVPSRDCKNDQCIIPVLNAEIRMLADRSLPDSARATALKWVVHLVGDIQQPLHGGERGDRGGNDVHVVFNGRPTNLHALWDSGLLLSYGQTEPEMVQQILDNISRRHDIDALGRSSVTQWAMESHDTARDMVYRDLPASLEITQAYADAARPIVYERLLRGGVRLAAVLERTLGS